MVCWQSLVNDQVLALTGRRYLSGYGNTEDEFKTLMDAGVAFAKQYQLTPGVVLTAEQMAQVTTDIVWLTAQSVTLADGSSQKVLVPQVYIRRARDQDLSVGGVLMAGSEVRIASTGDIGNSGSIAGDRVALKADKDIVNRGQVRGAEVCAGRQRPEEHRRQHSWRRRRQPGHAAGRARRSAADDDADE